MRARAWNEPVASEDDTKPRESPKVAARLFRIERPRELTDKVNFLFFFISCSVLTVLIPVEMSLDSD